MVGVDGDVGGEFDDDENNDIKTIFQGILKRTRLNNRWAITG